MSLETFKAIPAKQRRVKRSRFVIGPTLVTVLTEWDGEDMSRGEAPMVCPFSTLVYSEVYPNMMMATPDETKAKVAHEMMCGFVRAQGGKAGWRIGAYYLSTMWRNPRNVAQGWVNLALTLFVVVVQGMSLGASAILWEWEWWDLLPAAMVVMWGWLFANALRGLGDVLKERREKRRIAADKEAFEKIVEQIK